MNGQQSLLGGLLSWGTNATYSKGTAGLWLAGLVLIILADFLWSMVLREID